MVAVEICVYIATDSVGKNSGFQHARRDGIAEVQSIPDIKVNTFLEGLEHARWNRLTLAHDPVGHRTVNMG